MIDFYDFWQLYGGAGPREFSAAFIGEDGGASMFGGLGASSEDPGMVDDSSQAVSVALGGRELLVDVPFFNSFFAASSPAEPPASYKPADYDSSLFGDGSSPVELPAAYSPADSVGSFSFEGSGDDFFLSLFDGSSFPSASLAPVPMDLPAGFDLANFDLGGGFLDSLEQAFARMFERLDSLNRGLEDVMIDDTTAALSDPFILDGTIQ